MATYTAAQLNGAGTPCEELSGHTIFSITSSNNEVAYFTIETTRNANGFYDSLSPTSINGFFEEVDNVSNFITSSYIASVVVGIGGGEFHFQPDFAIQPSSSFFRGTGGISLNVTTFLTRILITENGLQLETEDGNVLIK